MTDEQELACVLVPLHDRQLLLPNVTVAEVVHMQRIQTVSNAPPWLVGMMSWRGKVVPVLSPEQVLAAQGDPEPPPRTPGCSLLVMNRSRPVEGVEFYVFLVRATPRMLRVTVEELEVLDRSLDTGEAARLRLGREEVTVPQLAYFEELVIQNRLTPRLRKRAPESASKRLTNLN